MKYFLLQGVFFQDVARLGVSLRSGEAKAVVKTQQEYTLFSGIIQINDDAEETTGEPCGAIMDVYGVADISHLTLTASTFVFGKQYRGRLDMIRYHFSKVGNEWIGSYKGDRVGTGTARCHLTEVKEEFFTPPLIPNPRLTK